MKKLNGHILFNSKLNSSFETLTFVCQSCKKENNVCCERTMGAHGYSERNVCSHNKNVKRVGATNFEVNCNFKENQ